MLNVEAHGATCTGWRVVLAIAAIALVGQLSAASAQAADAWIFASFSKVTGGETTWTDEVALPSRERCLELLDAALDSDVGTLRLVGVAASRTQDTVVGTDPKTRRMLLLTIYSCRPGPVPERPGPG